MRILVQDFSGHPFQVQLSRHLATRGHDVVHTYCPDYASGQGALATRPNDPPGFRVQPVPLAAPFDKYSIRRRLRQEFHYGRDLSRVIRSERPDVVISCNEPLLSKLALSRACKSAGIPWLFWLQDLYGVAMRRELERRAGPAGASVGWGLIRLESRLLSTASAVVSITPAFQDWMRRHGIHPEIDEVIQNWAPLDELEHHPERGTWFADRLGIGDAPVALYSGTLGRKHNADTLILLAERLDPSGHVVVISEGPSADTIAAAAKTRSNLHVLPFQPWSEFSDVLGSSSVLLAVLEENAGAFSVPSKILTYLCAGRPIVASMPLENLGASILEVAQAGVVVPANDDLGFLEGVTGLIADEAGAKAAGASAREYAERAFDIDHIAGRFEEILVRAVVRGHSSGRKASA